MGYRTTRSMQNIDTWKSAPYLLWKALKVIGGITLIPSIQKQIPIQEMLLFMMRHFLFYYDFTDQL
ncbi:MAG: hypothetical protein KIC94_06440 [Clostridiales bacterium]|nr:hypothetical protein [Clostridiales bacterium]